MSFHRIDGQGERQTIKLAEHVSFLNKVAIQQALDKIQQGADCEINAESTRFLHPDVEEVLEGFKLTAAARDIQLTYRSSKLEDATD